MGFRDRLTQGNSNPSDLSSSQSNEPAELTPLAQRFYGALLSLGQGDGMPGQVSIFLPTLVKSLQKQGLDDAQIIGMLGFASDFIAGILAEPVELEPDDMAAEVYAVPPDDALPYSDAVAFTPVNEGVEMVAEGAH